MFFKSTKSNFFVIVAFLMVFGLSTASVFQLILRNNLMLIITFQVICWVCIILLIWIYFSTNYTLTEEYLFYRTGPIAGKIKTADIKEVVIGSGIFVGFKPATGNNGLILKYNRWDEIYISPEKNEKFIEEILNLNKNILVTDLRSNT